MKISILVTTGENKTRAVDSKLDETVEALIQRLLVPLLEKPDYCGKIELRIVQESEAS
jgi:hypothetical protein